MFSPVIELKSNQNIHYQSYVNVVPCMSNSFCSKPMNDFRFFVFGETLKICYRNGMLAYLFFVGHFWILKSDNCSYFKVESDQGSSQKEQ